MGRVDIYLFLDCSVLGEEGEMVVVVHIAAASPRLRPEPQHCGFEMSYGKPEEPRGGVGPSSSKLNLSTCPEE